MITKGTRAAIVAAAAMAMTPVAAHASDAYWNQLCTNGGWTFNTCASAWVTANNNTITLRIWNLTGLPGSNTFANAGFTAIGLRNIGAGLVFANLSAYRVAGTGYAGWSLAQGGGGIPGPVGSNGVTISGIGDAIFSQYATAIPGNGSPEVTNWAGSGNFTGGGFVSFQFDAFTETNCTGNGANRVCDLVPATIDLTNAILGLHVQSGPLGASTGYECVADGSTTGGGLDFPCVSPPNPPPSVVPEPVTTTLLGTGLIGLALVDVRRRRNRKQQK